MEINKARNPINSTIASFLVTNKLNAISQEMSAEVFNAPAKKLERQEAITKNLGDWSYTLSLENHWYGSHVGAIKSKIDIRLPDNANFENLENWYFMATDLESNNQKKIPLNISQDGKSFSTGSAFLDLSFSREYKLSLKHIDNSDDQRVFMEDNPKDRPGLALKLHEEIKPRSQQRAPQISLSV